MFLLSHTFPYNGNPLFPYFGNCMDFCFKQKIPETLNLEMFVFFHLFPLLWEFPFPIFWEFYRFLLYLKYFRNSTLWNVCVFPYFFLTMGISFSHILGIAWISASSETFKTPKNLKCLCVFPFFFPHNGNPLFLCLGNCMDFCFTQNIWETHYSGMFVFSHTFPVLWEFTFPIFWDLYGFPLFPKYVRNTWPWDVLLSHTFPILSSLSPCFGDNTTDVKTLFLIPFSHKCYVKLFTKELNLFCSWAGPNISIFDPFVIEV